MGLICVIPFVHSGDGNMISLNDMFGFECLPRNHIDQLMINSLNEQLQYLYNQRMFAWELLELEEEQIPHSVYKYHNNKNTVDHLMSKPYGLFFFLDDCTRDRLKYEFITGMWEKYVGFLSIDRHFHFVDFALDFLHEKIVE